MKQEGNVRGSAASWLSLVALSPFVGAALIGCSDSDVQPEEPWGIRGELEVRIADYPDRAPETRYYLDAEDGTEYELTFDEVPAIEPGDVIEVNGVIEAGQHKPRILVDTFRTVEVRSDGLGESQQGLTNNTPRANYKVAALLVHWGNTSARGGNETAASMKQKIFTNTDSTGAFYKETSYGIQGIEGETFGWYQIDDPMSCDADEIGRRAREKATAAGVDLSKYQQIMYFFPERSDCGGWAGLAQLGRGYSAPARDSWYNGWNTCVVLAHELGHNYGHPHSHSCKSQPSSGVCSSYDEYGDVFSPMGGGCFHMNAVQKGQMNWFGKCNVVTANAGGTFKIDAMESPSDRLQALRVPRGNGRYFYVENRRPIGLFDKTQSGTKNTMYSGVLIYEGPEIQPVPYDWDPRAPFLIDTNSGTTTFDDAALQPGATYTSGSISIKLIGKDASGVAEVQVVVGGGSGNAVCLDGTTYTGTTTPPPPPPSVSIPAGTVSISVRHSDKCLDVANNASADGTDIIQWPCTGGDAQKFRFESVGGANYRIVHVSSNKCVDVSGNSYADGANVHLWTCNGTAAQTFEASATSNGFYVLRRFNASANKYMCIDVAGGTSATGDGANVHQWSCHNDTNQQWLPSTCSGVTLYQHTNYGGYGVLLRGGDFSSGELTSRGVIDNDISSLKVPAGCTATLYDDVNFANQSTLVKTADDASIVDDGWNDRMSSLRIR